MSPKKGSKYTQKSLFDVWIKKEHKDSTANVKIEEADHFSFFKESFYCPICDFNLTKFTLDARTVHVNRCIDPPREKEMHRTVERVESIETSEIVKIEESIVHKSPTKRKQSSTSPKPRKGRPKPPIPDHKILQFNEKNIIGVDAFCYASNENINTYLLTHFHSDHYGGMSKSWYTAVGAKYLICTPVTGRLVNQRFTIPSSCKLLETTYNHWIKVPETDIEIMALDANHCPGAGIFIIKCDGMHYLHCGDFRVCKSMIEQLQGYHFDRCYLDTTYLNPMYSFPKQENVIECTSQWIKTKSSTYKTNQLRILDYLTQSESQQEFLIVVGTYSIGKERLALGIAQALDTNIYCSKEKYKILSTYDWPELLSRLKTESPMSCGVHLLSMQKTKKDLMVQYLKEYASKYKSVLVIHPTGWSFNWKTKDELNDTLNSLKNNGLDGYVQLDDDTMNTALKEALEGGFKASMKAASKSLLTYRKISVPYSEHSSFRELFYFVNLVSVEKWITTVNKNQDSDQLEWLDSFQAYPPLQLDHL